jgi:hypothetical protein
MGYVAVQVKNWNWNLLEMQQWFEDGDWHTLR